jgi:TRAP-type mannitol/chloroaromatic compound transport system substrate-binding protein
VWQTLDAEMKAIIAHACAAEAGYALSEMERLNAEALAALVERHNVKLPSFPADVVAAGRRHAVDVLAELAGRDALARRVHDSYVGFRARTAAWSRVSVKAVLDARET